MFLLAKFVDEHFNCLHTLNIPCFNFHWNQTFSNR